MADGSGSPRDWLYLERDAMWPPNAPRPQPNQNTMIVVPVGKLRALADDVCAGHGIPRSELLSQSRRRSLVRIRWEFMWRARKETSASYPAIARALGGMDHTSVLHGVRKYAALMEAAQ